MNTVIDKPVPDFAAIKQRQQAPGGSGDYAVVGTTLQIVGETLVEAGDVRADERVLDVAAGNGNVSLAAARRFARVTSTDYVQALLDKGGAPALEPLSYLPVVLEQLDYGVVVLDATSRRALHVNQAAKDQLGPNGLLQLVDGVLATRLPSDRLTLLSALNEAAHRGLRRLVRIGGDARRIWISILPLHPGLELPGPVLVILGSASRSESLATAGFARINRLTAAETAVLADLCTGATPKEIARKLNVAITTVRTHVLQIRTKTGAASIRAIVAEVASLPPLNGILRTT